MEVAQLWPLSRSMRAKWRRCQNIASEMTIHLASPKPWHGRQVESRNLLIPTLQMRGLSWQQTSARHIAYPKDIPAVAPYYQRRRPAQIAGRWHRKSKKRGNGRSRRVSESHIFKSGFRKKNNLLLHQQASTSLFWYYARTVFPNSGFLAPSRLHLHPSNTQVRGE